MGRLTGKVALISGGARGQGATEAQLFCREDAQVVFGDVLDEDGRKVEAEIHAAGGEATYVHLNVTSEADWKAAGRCSRAVDSMSDGSPKLVAIDEETHDQIVHGCRFGEANGAAYKPLNASPQIDVLALNFLSMLLADDVLLRRDMPLVSTPSIRVKPCDTKGRQ